MGKTETASESVVTEKQEENVITSTTQHETITTATTVTTEQEEGKQQKQTTQEQEQVVVAVVEEKTTVEEAEKVKKEEEQKQTTIEDTTKTVIVAEEKQNVETEQEKEGQEEEEEEEEKPVREDIVISKKTEVIEFGAKSPSKTTKTSSDSIALQNVKTLIASQTKDAEPVISTTTTTTTSTIDDSSPEKKRHHTTSAIDMPLIDILKPSSTKKSNKNKNKNKKSQQQQQKEQLTIEDKLPLQHTPTTATQTSNANNVAGVVQTIDPALFKGLDPERMNKEASEEYCKQKELGYLANGEPIKFELPPTESTTETETQSSPTKDNEKQPEDKELDEKPVKEESSGGAPPVIDMKKVAEYVYTPPANIRDSWNADPLPSVIIGLHKVDFSVVKPNQQPQQTQEKQEQPTKQEDQTQQQQQQQQQEKEKEKQMTTTTVVVITNEPDDAVVEKHAVELLKGSVAVKMNIPTTTTTTASPSTPAQTVAVNLDEKIKEFSASDLKLLKSNRKEIVTYLKEQTGYTSNQLLETQTMETGNKSNSCLSRESQAKEKLVEKMLEKSVKLLASSSSKSKFLTYRQLNDLLHAQLEKRKLKSPKDKLQTLLLTQIRTEINQGTLIYHNNNNSKTRKTASAGETKDDELLNNKNNNTTTTQKLTAVIKKASSAERLASATDPLSSSPGVMKRVPSLTWREANERARILFYKGRVPSIHYNEKRDSFRVSMLASSINSADGTEQCHQVPVSDDDVRRLLNSCGLYWNGESISLLNKSDEIFINAQHEAFQQILESINTATATATATTKEEKQKQEEQEKKEQEKENVVISETVTTRTTTTSSREEAQSSSKKESEDTSTTKTTKTTQSTTETVA